jgi:Tol biopolymer transport system component
MKSKLMSLVAVLLVALVIVPLGVTAAPPAGYGEISGGVWNDADGDGVWQANEQPLPGIHVRLLAADGLFIGSLVTNPQGRYLFSWLKAGQYRVVVDAYDAALPAGYSLSTAGYYAANVVVGQTFTAPNFGFGPLMGGADCPDYLLFESERGRQVDIWKLEPGRGGVLTNLTNNSATDRDAARSADGQWIAFQSTRTGRWQLFMVSADGLVTQRLTNVNADTEDPQWAPDSGAARLAYTSKQNGNWDIRVLTVATMDDQRLTASPANDVNPNWSPDGQQIAFESNRDGHWQLYIMGWDGSGQRRLTTSRNDDRNPVWSPDGSKIAFESNRDGRWQTYVLDRASGQVRNVGQGKGYDVNPAWSPDGSRLAFQSSRSGAWGIYTANADGTGLRFLTGAFTPAQNPAWSCDGADVLFQGTDRNGNRDVYAMAADGATNLRRLTIDAAFDGIPVWYPAENDARRPFDAWVPWKQGRSEERRLGKEC